MNNESNSYETDIFLASLGIFSDDQLKALKEHWIETPQQLVATASTEEGRQGLKTLLEVDEPTLESIILEAEEHLTIQERNNMHFPRKGGELGVRFDDKKK